MQGRARRKSDQGVCWLSGNSHCVLRCGWSRFRGNQPFSPWFQFPHALQPLLLCDSLETFWHRPPASCQRAECCEPEDKKKEEIPRKVSTKTSTCQRSGCFWTASQMPAYSLFMTSHHVHQPDVLTIRTIWNLYLNTLPCWSEKWEWNHQLWNEFFLSELTLLYLAFGCRLFSTASTHSCSLDESI